MRCIPEALILVFMDITEQDKPLTPERLEKALVMVAHMALSWGNEFDFGPTLDVLKAELKKARANDQFAKARAILKSYDE